MNGIWSALEPVGLDELNGLAALDTRVDRKYVVPLDVIEGLAEDLAADLRILQIDGLRRFAYETVYFDTPRFDLYLAAARSRPKRFKVRTRTYLDSQLCSLEVKARDGRDRTVKHRRVYAFEDRDRLTHAGHAFVEGIVGEAAARGALRPVLTNYFTRQTLLIPGAAVRATIDSEYRCQVLDCEGRATLSDGVIIETKSAGRASPLDLLLWRAGHRPLRISKYCTGLAAAHGGLPANKWHRTIDRHLTAAQNSGVVDLAASEVSATPATGSC